MLCRSPARTLAAVAGTISKRETPSALSETYKSPVSRHPADLGGLGAPRNAARMPAGKAPKQKCKKAHAPIRVEPSPKGEKYPNTGPTLLLTGLPSLLVLLY